MTLEDVSKELESLENDKIYYENRLEALSSLIYPGSSDFSREIVDGGKRVDKISKYVELETLQQLKAHLKYIESKIKDLTDWKDREIERLAKYGEYVRLIVFLREKEFIRDSSGKVRHLTWEEIGRKAYCSDRTARNWYKLGTEERKKSV